MSDISIQQENNEVFQKSFTTIENTTSSFHHSLSVVLPAYNTVSANLWKTTSVSTGSSGAGGFGGGGQAGGNLYDCSNVK